MYKMLVLISKFTMLHMVYIKTHSTLIAMQTNATFTAHVSGIFLADLASSLCG